jgi:hypothetical protein
MPLPGCPGHLEFHIRQNRLRCKERHRAGRYDNCDLGHAYHVVADRRGLAVVEAQSAPAQAFFSRLFGCDGSLVIGGRRSAVATGMRALGRQR